MITNGWFDFAERIPAPLEKCWEDNPTKEAVFFHSAVGTYQSTVDVVLQWPQPVNPRSVTAVVRLDGHLAQFYPLQKSPWANGSHEWNTKAWGIEFEGGYNGDGHTVSEPITDEQVDTAANILEGLSEFKTVGLDYWQRPSTLKEHREVYPTACPSDRIRWNDILAKLTPTPTRTFLYGNEQGGREKRGKQLIDWNEGVEIWAYGDVAGTAVGQTWHNVAGVWVKVAE